MHSKILLRIIASVALLSLVNCSTLKDPPDVDLCTMLQDKSGLYCVSYFYEGREYEVPAAQAFEEKYFAISPDHMGELQAYGEYLEREAKKRYKK